VEYVEDTSDLCKFATVPTVTSALLPKNFALHLSIGDIVAINGEPAKGTMTRNSRPINHTNAPNPGRGIADAVRGAVTVDTFEILSSTSTAIGTIITSGLAPGVPALGAPVAVTQGNFAVIGGTGAFRSVSGNNTGTFTTPFRPCSPFLLASVATSPAPCFRSWQCGSWPAWRSVRSF